MSVAIFPEAICSPGSSPTHEYKLHQLARQNKPGKKAERRVAEVQGEEEREGEAECAP